jgi:hypothetical protein
MPPSPDPSALDNSKPGIQAADDRRLRQQDPRPADCAQFCAHHQTKAFRGVFILETKTNPEGQGSVFESVWTKMWTCNQCGQVGAVELLEKIGRGERI